jgi:hypothetical protein
MCLLLATATGARAAKNITEKSGQTSKGRGKNMSSRLIAIVEGSRQSIEADTQQRAVSFSSHEVDWCIKLLAEVAMRAQSMSRDDQRRVYSCLLATCGMMNATTTMEKGDQAKFESALYAAKG